MRLSICTPRSLDNKYLVYGISIGGSEETVLHVMDIAHGQGDRRHHQPGSLHHRFVVPDGRFLFSRLQKLEAGAPPSEKYKNQRVYIHRLGQDPDRDPVVFGADVSPTVSVAPAEQCVVTFTPGSSYVIAQAINGPPVPI